MDSLLNIIQNFFKDESEEDLSDMIESRRTDLGLSKRQLERVLQMNYNTIESLKEGDIKRFNIVNAVKLANFLNVGLQKAIELVVKNIGSEAIKELEDVRKATFIVNNFDLKKLKQINFIDSIQDFEKIENRINMFFGFDSIFEYQSSLGTALFSKTRRSANDKMKEFWIKSAYACFEEINNPNDYDRNLLKELIPKIRPYTRNVDEGLKTVALALRNAGINLIFQQHLTTTQIRGATFVVNDNPSIVITDLNKNYATIWFALMHELHHVLYDLDHLKSVKYHLTGEPDLFLVQEEKANEFARDYLFDETKLKRIKPFIHNEAIVAKHAKDAQVHPSIIYSSFQYYMDGKGENYWGAFKEHFPDVERALKGLNTTMWEYGTIEEATKNLEEVISTFN